MNKHCTNCGTELNPGSKFCHNCARPVDRVPKSGFSGVLPWIIAAITVVVAGTMAVKKMLPALPPPTTNLAPTQLAIPQTPKAIGDQFFDTAMRAVDSGDRQTVLTYSRRALDSYSLTPIDADTRFHMGLLYLNLGHTDSTMAQADSIVGRDPNHLFAPMLQHRVAEITGDETIDERAFTDFRSNYQLETALGRPEYQSHSRLVQSFAQEAGL